MFIIKPDPYSLPSYRIGPFRTIDISINNKLPEKNSIDGYFQNRFNNRHFSYCINGRSAIYKALDYYQLKKEDTVTILTTTNNFYISGCVTAEIEKFCNWSREMTPKTKVIFVNHEFGHPYENLEALKKYKLPIIEDCAHAFFSKDKNSLIGKVGDFVIYSFPKMFPFQIGGLLVSNIETEIESDLDEPTLKYIKKVLSHYIKEKDIIIKKRIEVYKALKKELIALGFTERFKLKEGIVPGVFMFNVPDEAINLDRLKSYLWAHGIQCSVFYGERAFFLPCHQSLTDEDVRYFAFVIKNFINKK